MDLRIIKFSLHLRDGTSQHIDFDEATALVGSGPQCDVRLSATDAAPEQLQLFIQAGRLMGSVHSSARPTLLDGVPYVGGPIARNAALQFGGVTLRVEVGQSSLSAKSDQPEGKRKLLLYAFAAIGLPLAFYVVLSDAPSANPLKTTETPPLLWQAEQETCPQADGEAAASFGRAEWMRAEAARERAPFNGREGVQAVTMFRRAAACFRQSGRLREAESAAASASNIKENVQREFRVHCLSLERALSRTRYAEALVEVRVLLQFLGSDGGAYRAWLLTLQRKIELQFAGKKS